MADDVYTRLSQDVMDNSTLGLTQIEGKTYVTITGRVNFHKQALNELKKIAFDLGINFVDNPGRIHAEKLLYYEYNMDQAFKGIGISNRRGPCPTCESFFKEEVLFDRVFWTGLYK